MTETNQDPLKGRRRRGVRLTLRTLLLITLAVAVWLGMITHAAHRQRMASTALRELGLAVHYDYQAAVLSQSELTFPADHRVRRFYPGFSTMMPQPPAPVWLRSLTGDEYFQTVTAVSIYDHFPTQQWEAGYRPMIDEALPHLRRLPALKKVFLHQPRDHVNSPIYKEVVNLLGSELPDAEVVEFGFVTIR